MTRLEELHSICESLNEEFRNNTGEDHSPVYVLSNSVYDEIAADGSLNGWNSEECCCLSLEAARLRMFLEGLKISLAFFPPTYMGVSLLKGMESQARNRLADLNREYNNS